MAQLDASVIGDIGGSGPDIAGSTAKGLTLADLYDQNTLNKGKIAEQKQSQADMTYAKQILAGKDLTKLDDQNAAVAEITKRNPQLGMQLMRGFADQQGNKNANDLEQLKLYEAKNDVIGGAVVSLKTKHDELLAKGMNEQQIHDAMQQDVMSTLQQLTQAKLPNGQPLMNDQDRKNATDGLKNGYSVPFIDGLVAKSTQAKQAIEQKLKQADSARKDKDEERKEKATDASIALGTRKADQGDRKLTDAEQLARTKQIMDGEGKFEPDDAKALAEQYLAGDKSVLTGLGRGKQGAQNIIMVRRAIANEGKAQGLSPADIAARLAEYSGYTAEQRSLGTRSANIETASREAYNMIDVAKKASDDVPRGQFLPWNKLVRGEDVLTQDPQYAKFAAATLAVVNTWARAISPSGTPTVADKEHANSVLNTAQSPEAYKAVLDQFKTEIEQALKAPSDTKQALHDRFVGGAGGGGARTATQPSADPAAPLPTAAGGGAPAKVVNWNDL